MAKESGMVSRGLVLLGLMLILVTVVGFILFQPADTAPTAQAKFLEKTPSAPGWEVRYNATTALARRGSSKLPCAVLAEMLDEDQQLRNYVEKDKEGVDVIDEHGARQTVLTALNAAAEWLKHTDAVAAVQTSDAVELHRVYAAIDKLTQSNNTVLRKEAEKVKKALPN